MSVKDLIQINDPSDRKQIIKDLAVFHSALLKAVDSLNGQGSRSTGYADVIKFPFFQWMELNPRIRFRRRANLADLVVFDCVMQKGAEFGTHYHPDLLERCDVVSGHLVDLTTGLHFKQGEIYQVEPGDEHTPVAIDRTVLRVFFERVK